MRRIGRRLSVWALFILTGVFAYAQSSVDELEKELSQVQQDRKDAATQAYTNFLTQLDTASQSPDAALALYKSVGGPLPPGEPVKTAYDHETPTEQEAREADDNAKLVNLAYVAQVHCGLMKFAAMFITTPDQKGLHDDWIAWLKNAPTIYLQIKNDGIPQVGELKNKSVRDSVISTGLGFTQWGDKEQAGWTVAGLAELYRSDVLEPLRANPNADTLAAWDVYISLKSANQPDTGKWTQIEYPSLMFKRGCDDYEITHSMDKLQTLLDIIKANPSHPKIDEMISRVHDLAQDYKKRQTANTAPAPAATAADGAGSTNANVTVTTATQGDMTIVTTRTNAAPNPNAPPAH